MTDPTHRARTFVDAVGVEWTVVEVANPAMPPSLAKILREDRRRGGWLAFQGSDGDRRRLSPYPNDWAEVTDFELERWCMRATRVPPGPARRQQDSE